MQKETMIQLLSSFEQSVKTATGTGQEYWLARELQVLLGYASWQTFSGVIERAVIACETAGQPSEDHFRVVPKMVALGSGAQRDIKDAALSRYACYLIAMNGDPAKEPIAFAQTYFAVQTRKMEVIEQRLADMERLKARRELTLSEKELSGLINERLGNDESFGRIRSKGDEALFGGHSTQKMKKRLGVPQSRALADFLPTITIKAKDFANEITNVNVKKSDLKAEPSITTEHVKSNKAVRKALQERNIIPEFLPPAEDVKKMERRLKKVETRELPLPPEKLEDTE